MSRQDPAGAPRVLGKPTPRIDAVARVTGRAVYTGDVRLPGMLYARVLRSPHPHARITRLDTSKAEALAGVKAIITRDNCDVVWSGGGGFHPRYLFNNPVRFAGDAVAAVAAVDRHVAEEALALIEVDYEVLDFVIDPEEALRTGAVEIHPGGNKAPDARGRLEPEGVSYGDVEAGFAEADRVFEQRFTSPHINNAQMEPRVSVAQWDGDKLTVYASTQGISNCVDDIVHDLKLTRDKVRVICNFMGGGFGNKNQCHDFDLMAAELAKRAGVPVKVEFTRKEDFVSVHGRWPTRQSYKVGVKRDGTLTAIRMRAVSGMGPYRKGSGNINGTELYTCPNVDVQIQPVYTNMAVSANFRAPAYPQGVFGIESLMDHIAHELQIDPVEFRIRVMTRRYHGDVPYSSFGLEDCFRRGAEAFGWRERWHTPGAGAGPLKRGVGVAMGSFGARLGRAEAILKLDASGRYTLYVGVTDIGTGAKTTMALIAAEALGVPLDRVDIVSGDTDRCPYSPGESGSRTTGFTGYAVVEAARQLEEQLAAGKAPTADAPLVVKVETAPTLEGVARYSFAVHFVEVEVDTETGRVTIPRYIALQDSGRIVNPLTSMSQVRGGVTMGIGMALHEELIYDPRFGLPVNPGYYGARVPTHLDVPDIEVEFVETEDAYGPFGAKAVGEPPIVPSPAAIANAIFNATGRRFTDLPITRDKILGALA